MVKSEAMPVVKQHDMKVYGGWRYIKFADRGGYERSGSLPNQHPPNCWGMNQWFLLDGMFSGPQSQSELWDEGKSHFSLSGINLCSPVIQPVAYSCIG